MVIFYDISEWQEKPWYQTGGTRSKVIVENPENRKEYYFKTSLKKEKKDYKYEFWSEIIASEIGLLFGFDLLKYDIALKDNEIGCISESMITNGKNELTEGIRYLTGFDSTYNPEDPESKKKYTFDFIQKALKHFDLNGFVNNVIEIIIFDAIIGNRDRHQENWGVITQYNGVINSLDEIIADKNEGFVTRMIAVFVAGISKSKDSLSKTIQADLQLRLPHTFAPIYDSGSSLGREMSDVEVGKMLKDCLMFEAYIRRGKSEIHWQGNKVRHFELISNLLMDHGDTVRKIVHRVESEFDEQKIWDIVSNIDLSLPNHSSLFKLPSERKEFIAKLLTLRTQKLIQLIH